MSVVLLFVLEVQTTSDTVILWLLLSLHCKMFSVSIPDLVPSCVDPAFALTQLGEAANKDAWMDIFGTNTEAVHWHTVGPVFLIYLFIFQWTALAAFPLAPPAGLLSSHTCQLLLLVSLISACLNYRRNANWWEKTGISSSSRRDAAAAAAEKSARLKIKKKVLVPEN